jgi:hypothetical protein
MNLIESSNEKFEPYIDGIYKSFDSIINAENVENMHIFTLIIVIYADLFNYVGKNIWKYECQKPMNFMIKILDFSKQNHEHYLDKKIEQEELFYFLKLNEGVVDFIKSVAGNLMNNNDVTQKFKDYLENIIDYLKVMMADQMFQPNEDYINSCLSFLKSFIEIYGDDFRKKVDNYIWERIVQLAENSDNNKSLKDGLLDTLKGIKNQSGDENDSFFLL